MSKRDTSVQSWSSDSTPIRVLMADPDTSLPPMYREPLLREGIELETAVSGIECIARMRERVPDVLVLEPHMPWGGGDGVLEIMGEVPRFASIPVMVLTSCRDPRCPEPRGELSDQRLSPQTDRTRSIGEAAPLPARTSQTAFHLSGTNRSPGMRDRQANRRSRPKPTCRDGWRTRHRARLFRLTPRQATGSGRGPGGV